MKKLLTALLIAAIIAMTLPRAFAAEPSLDNFQKQRDYDSRFYDVLQKDWFYDSVRMGFEFDLINGVSGNSFAPSREVTIAEILALASRLHSIYSSGEASFTQDSPWYQVYVDYADENGFLIPDLDSYNRAALRGEVAEILAKTLPFKALPPITLVENNEIPDVKMNTPYADSIYLLYRAGILTGSDVFGTFHPDDNIKRSEIATIIARMVNPDARETGTFDSPAELYTAHFEARKVNGVNLSVQGVTMRFSGNVNETNPRLFTNIVLTRDNEVVNNPLTFTGKISHNKWGDEEVTDFYFKFERENTEPGTYELSGRYRGEPFSLVDIIIEKPVGNTPADPDSLYAVYFSCEVDKNDNLKTVTEVSFYFSGLHEKFLQSDLSDLVMTRDGEKLQVSFEPDVFRYTMSENNRITTFFSILIKWGGFSTPGTYQITGTYRGTEFTSVELTI